MTSPSAPRGPKVSVVVPTLARPAALVRALDQYLATLRTYREQIAAHDPHLNELFVRAQESRQQWQVAHDSEKKQISSPADGVIHV